MSGLTDSSLKPCELHSLRSHAAAGSEESTPGDYCAKPEDASIALWAASHTQMLNLRPHSQVSSIFFVHNRQKCYNSAIFMWQQVATSTWLYNLCLLVLLFSIMHWKLYFISHNMLVPFTIDLFKLSRHTWMHPRYYVETSPLFSCSLNVFLPPLQVALDGSICSTMNAKTLFLRAWKNHSVNK